MLLIAHGESMCQAWHKASGLSTHRSGDILGWQEHGPRQGLAGGLALGGCPTGLGRPVTDSGAFPVFWELAAGGSYPGPYLPRGKAGLGFRNLLVWFGSSLPGSQRRREEEGRGRGDRGDGGRVNRKGGEQDCEGKAGGQC